MNVLNYSGNLSILKENIIGAFKEKFHMDLPELENVPHVHFGNLPDNIISFTSYIVEKEDDFICTYFISVDGKVTYVGEYILDIIDTDSLLPTIIDFVTIVTSEVNEKMVFEFSYELACVTKKAALKFGKSDLVFLVIDDIIQEKIDKLKKQLN